MKGKHAKTTAKKLKLAKRTLALCFAVVFLCSCMLPVFATGSSLTDALREAVEETTTSMEGSTESAGGTMMDSFQSYYSDYIAEKATTYRFWLDEKDSYDLEGITSTSASELAQYDDFYKVVRIENNAPLSAPDGFKTPADPTGAGRKFEGWYYIDLYGLTQTFTFNGDIQSIDTDSTVDVFAKWGEAPAETPATKNPKQTAEDGKTANEDSVPPYPFEDDEEETVDDGIMLMGLYDDMIAVTAATNPDYTVSVGRTVNVTGTVGYQSYNYHTWSSSDSTIATVTKTGTGETATVTGKKAGTVTLTHEYWVWRYGQWKATTETFTVKVTSSGTSSGGTTAQQPRSTEFTFTITDADVIYVHYDSRTNAAAAGNLEFNTVTGNFTTAWDHAYDNYWLFFVKPDDNYMVTGIGASGTNTEDRNDIYSVDGDYTNIQSYPGIDKLVERAKELGYVGMFGYSRKSTDTSIFTEASINVMGEQPKITVEAVSNKTTDVKPDDELEFTVTITPGHTGKATVGYTARETVEGVEIDSLLINGVDYKDVCTELVPHRNTKGEIEYYTTTVPYTATRQDCNNGLVRMEVEAAVKYNVHLNAQDSDTVKTEATISSKATTDCLIAPQSDVRYVVAIENKPTSYPAELDEVPVDNKTYYVGENVYTETEWPEKTIIDAENGGVWTFDGWYLGTEAVTRATMVEGGLVFHGTWKFTKTMSSFWIAKSVIGNLGDRTQEFNFNIDVKDDEGQSLSFKLDGAEKTGTATFTLKDGESVPLVSVPMGATVTITEMDAEGYKINAKLGGDYLSSSWMEDTAEFTFTVATSSVSLLSLEEDGEEDLNLVLQSAVAGGQLEEGNVITIINSKDMEVPTGVILDTLPYILMLIAVGAGVVIFIIRKRHHDDD